MRMCSDSKNIHDQTVNLAAARKWLEGCDDDYADLRGRKAAMLAAVLGVGLATASFGALPTVRQIGPAASVLFILLRLVQGMFVGGVVASTLTIGIESVPGRWRRLVSGSTGLSSDV